MTAVQRAELSGLHPTMTAAHGLPQPVDEPVVHYSHTQDVALWRLKEVRKLA